MTLTSPSGASRPASLADALIAFDAAELELLRVRRELYDAERRLGDRAAQCLALQDAHADAAAMLAEVASERDRLAHGSAARDAALDACAARIAELLDRLAALRAGASAVADSLEALVAIGTLGPGARVGVEALATWLREIVGAPSKETT